jgi:hypothetical protein
MLGYTPRDASREPRHRAVDIPSRWSVSSPAARVPVLQPGRPASGLTDAGAEGCRVERTAERQYSLRGQRCGTGCYTAIRFRACWLQISARIGERDSATSSTEGSASADANGRAVLMNAVNVGIGRKRKARRRASCFSAEKTRAATVHPRCVSRVSVTRARSRATVERDLPHGSHVPREVEIETALSSDTLDRVGGTDRGAHRLSA